MKKQYVLIMKVISHSNTYPVWHDKVFKFESTEEDLPLMVNKKYDEIFSKNETVIKNFCFKITDELKKNLEYKEVAEVLNYNFKHQKQPVFEKILQEMGPGC